MAWLSSRAQVIAPPTTLSIAVALVTALLTGITAFALPGDADLG